MDGRLTRADLVDPATHDFQRLTHSAIIRCQLFRFAQLDGEDITRTAHGDVAGACTGQAGDRIGETTHHFQRTGHAIGIGDLETNLPLRRGLATEGADLSTFRAQRVPDLRPQRIHARGINILDLHLGKKMRTTAQVQTKIDEIGRQERRPLTRHLQPFGGFPPQRNFGGGVIGLLDARIKRVRQGKQKAGHTDQPDEDPLPEINLQHCPAFSIG